MSEELKPVRCGCGGAANVETAPFVCYDELWGEPESQYVVWCNSCGIGTRVYNTKVEAITAWNRAMKGNGEEKLKAFWDGMSAEMKEERKIGKWVYDGIRGRFPACKCSICGHYENADWALLQGANYCPNCGAEMGGE